MVTLHEPYSSCDAYYGLLMGHEYRSELLDRVAQEGGMAPFGGGSPLFPATQVGTGAAGLRRTGPSMSVLLLILVPLALLVMLYVFLDYRLLQEAAELVSPLTEGL